MLSRQRLRELPLVCMCLLGAADHVPCCGFEQCAEDVFNDGFWDGIDVVVNALDNVNAR